MNHPFNHDRIDDLFTRATELPAAERSAFVQKACNGDSELLAEVERLLSAHDEAERSQKFLAPLHANNAGKPKPESGGRYLEVRCPSCYTPMEVAVDTQLTDLTCSYCGSHFSLVDQSKATRIAPSLSKLGRFDLIERLGVGGFGSVWKARDKELDRTVAIKIPREGGMTGEDQDKFFREARAAAQLRHPNIVSVHEVGRDGDSVYIVSDFVRGVTLSDWLTSQQLTGRETAELCAKIADALHHAHEHGVVHRDLKPANIMMDSDASPHLMDFGLARRETGEVTMTMDGHVLGTPAYMSPEQAEGKGHQADRRSDLYSLGVISFQLLTGELPFRGNARMLIHQVIHDEPPSPRKLNANISKDLETITLKCLEKDPARRYQTAKELSEEYRRYTSGSPILARPTSRLEGAWRWAKRRPAAALLLAVLAGISVVGPIVAAQQAILRNQTNLLLAERESYIVEKTKAFAQREEAFARLDKKTEDLQEQLARNLIDHGVAECESGKFLLGIALLGKAYDVAPPSSQLRTAARNLVGGWSAHIGAPLLHDSSVYDAAFSPDGAKIVTSTAGGANQLWDVKTGNAIGRRMQNGSKDARVIFDPAGRIVATCGFDGTLRLWDATTCKPIGKVMRHTAPVRDIAFSPDGRKIVSGSYDHTARIWDVATGDPIGSPLRHDDNIHAVAFSPDGNSVLTASYDKTARLWDVNTGQPIGKPMPHKGRVFNAAFSPDGETIVTGEDFAARRWNAKTAAPFGGPMKGGAFVVVYSPDGQTILSGGYDRTARLWNAKTGRPLHEPLQHSGTVRVVAFSPDSKLVATGSEDRTARLWSVETGQPLARPIEHYESVEALAFSPDGRFLLTGSRDNTARLWDTKTCLPAAFGDADRQKKQIASLTLQAAPCAAAFSPDSAKLATGTQEGDIQLWSTDTGRSLAQPMHHDGQLQAIAFTSDSRTLITASNDGTTKLWQVDSGELIGPPISQGKATQEAIFSKNADKLIVAGYDRTVQQWSAKSGQPLDRPMYFSTQIGGIALSPDSSRLLTADGSMAYLWDLNARKPFGKPMRHANLIRVSAFSPDGKFIVTGGQDNSAQLWDAQSTKLLGPSLPHNGKINALAISPNNQVILSGSDDGFARLWDVASGKLLCEPFAHESAIQVVAISPDGNRMAVGDSDGHVQLLDIAEFSVQSDKIFDSAKVSTGFVADEKGAIRKLSQSEWLSAKNRLLDHSSTSQTVNEPVQQSDLRPSIAELWNDVGEVQSVEFDVAITGRAPGLIFLNSIKDFRSPECFTVAIDESERINLKLLGINNYKELEGRHIRVKGTIVDRVGRLEIQVPLLATQLEIRSPTGTWVSAAVAPQSIPDERLDPPLTRLREVVGKECTVNFRVQDVIATARTTFRASSSSQSVGGFSVIIDDKRPSPFSAIGVEEAKELVGKDISVTGTVEELIDRENRIEIHVGDVAKQLKFNDGVDPVVRFESIVETRREKLGIDHPNTLVSMEQLADRYSEAGRLTDAVSMQEQIVAARRGKVGEADPENLKLMSRLASNYVNAHQLDDAARTQKMLCEQILGLSRNATPEERYWAAVSLLGEKKIGENRRICRDLLEAFVATRDNDVADRAVYAYVAGPVPEANAKQLMEAAAAVKDRFPGNERVVGACLYRAAEYEKALQAFGESHQKFSPVAWDYCFLAMLHSKLGHKDEAAKALAAARSAHKVEVHTEWYSRVETEALLTEAASIIEEKPSAATKSSQNSGD